MAELAKADLRRSDEGGLRWDGMVEVGGRKLMWRSGQEQALIYVVRTSHSHATGRDGDNETIEKCFDTDGAGT